MAESILNQLGSGQFVAYSAGSFPTRRINPFALELLRQNRTPTDALRSKAWDEFAKPGAPHLDFVFAVCDKAANETCPIWPGQPMSAHWGVADPAAVQGSEADKRHAFFGAFRELSQRIRIFTSLPIRQLDSIKLQERLNAIGRSKLTDDVMMRRLAEALGALVLAATVIGCGFGLPLDRLAMTAEPSSAGTPHPRSAGRGVAAALGRIVISVVSGRQVRGTWTSKRS